MNKAEKIRNKYNTLKERELEALQSKCNHTKLTGWMDYQWAIGHSTGYQVQLCAACDKELHRKTCCLSCNKELVDEAIIEGDGNATPIGTNYCQEDFDAAKKKYDSECHANYDEMIKGKGYGYAWICDKKPPNHEGKHHGTSSRGEREWEGSSVSKTVDEE